MKPLQPMRKPSPRTRRSSVTDGKGVVDKVFSVDAFLSLLSLSNFISGETGIRDWIVSFTVSLLSASDAESGEPFWPKILRDFSFRHIFRSHILPEMSWFCLTKTREHKSIFPHRQITPFPPVPSALRRETLWRLERWPLQSLTQQR